MSTKPEGIVTQFPSTKASRIFPLAFIIAENWPTKDKDFLHGLFIRIIFTNEHNFYEFWSLNTIARSKKLNIDYKQTTWSS